VILSIAMAVPWIGNVTFREETVHTLIVGRVVIAQLESVVLTVYSLSVIRTMEIPGPDTGVILHIPEAEISHALSQAVNIQAVKSIAVIGGFHERNGVFVYFLLHLGKIPFRMVPYRVTFCIKRFISPLNNRSYVPESALIQMLPFKCGIPTGIRYQKKVFNSGNLIP